MFGEITPPEVKARLHNGEKLTIIDVRELEEVQQGMIPEAIHIPLATLPNRYQEFNSGDEIIIVCRSGARSGSACEFLTQLGYTNAKNMVGGMLEWATQN